VVSQARTSPQVGDVRAGEPKVRLLDGVFGVRQGAEHPVSDTGEMSAVPFELGC
jgi:hypothetical protein